MQIVNCHVPLKVRLTGEVGEDHWSALENALASKYSSALRRSLQQLSPAGPASARRDNRERFESSRMHADNYPIPSYDQGGQPTAVPTDTDRTSSGPASVPSVADIVRMIRERFPEQDAAPGPAGVLHGTYVTLDGTDGPLLYYLDEHGRVRTRRYFTKIRGEEHPIELTAGSYTMVLSGDDEGSLFRRGQLRAKVRNVDRATATVQFFVPEGPDEVRVLGPGFTYYPRVELELRNDPHDMTTGAIAVYLARVTIWRRDRGDNWLPLPPLALHYSSVHYGWEVWKLLPGKEPGAAPRRFMIRKLEPDPHNAFLHHEWKEAGKYEIRCSVELRLARASPQPVSVSRTDDVEKLEVKQATVLALLEKEEAALSGRRTTWAQSPEDLLANCRSMLATATDAGDKRAISELISRLTQHVIGASAAGPFSIHAIYTDRRTSQTRPLSLFIGPAKVAAEPRKVTWLLMDTTAVLFYATYEGTGATPREAIRAAFEAFRTSHQNKYPPGQVLAHVDWPGMDKFGLQPWLQPIETESWQREAFEWLEFGAQGLGAIALAASIVVPPTAPIVTGAIILSMAVGAGVSVANLISRANADNLTWNAETASDIVNIAAALTLFGGVGARSVATGIKRGIPVGEQLSLESASRLVRATKLQNFSRAMAYGGIAGNFGNGVILTWDTYVQICDVNESMSQQVLQEYVHIYGPDEGKKRWEMERYVRILGVLARAAVNGAVIALSMRVHETTGRAASTTPVPSASTAAEYLNTVRSQVRSAESVGVRWDSERFPEGIPNHVWEPGDPVDMPTGAGDYPRYGKGPMADMGRNRMWRNRAHFELLARGRSEVHFDPTSFDPIRRLPDAELQSMRTRGNSPPDPRHPGRVVELEHSGVPQRVRAALEDLGFSDVEASRLTDASDPLSLMEATRLEHAFLDAEAASFGRYRGDLEGQTWAGSAAADPRVQRPLQSMSDANIVRLVERARALNLDFNRTRRTVGLRVALHSEIRIRRLAVALP
ncbi:hypothetical protein IVB30_20215 [Bradyrhizobium sp. 200]|uniref:hypothetical protein n=1 Tax=Bradyrhizobium sp. 200 TaxID=2782665 RepID=UPI001FFE4C58|nr:hypothetical protein [Bradyrhizobium sp. 200]UPJ53433.1 hypothetical protein IVB30_20215 [Bradyrhizobium sp. 200]